MLENHFKEEFIIENKPIGTGYPCFIIAEAGSNHNGIFEQALKLIDVAVESGCDAIKFQTFTAKKMYINTLNPANYLLDMGIKKSVYDVIKEMEMPLEWIPKLAEYCKLKKIIFLSTPFDEDSADLLEPYVSAFKIASYEMTHVPLIIHIANKNKPMLISTGAASMNEVEETLNFLSKTDNKSLCLFQCTAKYPAPLDSLNLNVLDSFKKKWKIPLGFSDHSSCFIVAPLISVGKGVNMIEKHFTLSRRLPGPDHTYALEPDELKKFVSLIREAELTLGDGIKEPSKVEAELRNYRRGVFATKKIKIGEKFSTTNTSVLRRSGMEESDLKPKDYHLILGKSSSRTLPINSLISKSDCNYEF